jgi:hypothetical protein
MRVTFGAKIATNLLFRISTKNNEKRGVQMRLTFSCGSFLGVWIGAPSRGKLPSPLGWV